MVLPDPFQELALFDNDSGVGHSLQSRDCHRRAHTARHVGGCWSWLSILSMTWEAADVVIATRTWLSRILQWPYQLDYRIQLGLV